MKRRDFLKISTALGLGQLSNQTLSAQSEIKKAEQSEVMRAGFGRSKINCALGMKMNGWAGPRYCAGIHDDIYVRALYLEQGNEKAVLMGFDLCLMGRDETDRFKSAIGRRFDIYPRQILMNASHSHVSPYSGTWWDGLYDLPDRDYQNVLEEGAVEAVKQAKNTVKEVSLWVAKGHTNLPVCRRKPKGDGTVEWAPYPEGITYNNVPICLFKDKSGTPVCLLFSASTHASFKHGNIVSAEWPGAAIIHLDRHFGRNISLFLQGMAGDSKAYMDN